jgi:hypothetical protein
MKQISTIPRITRKRQKAKNNSSTHGVAKVWFETRHVNKAGQVTTEKVQAPRSRAIRYGCES